MNASNPSGTGGAPDKLVVKLGKLALKTQSVKEVLEQLDEADIETALEGCPEAYSDALVLFAMMVSRFQDGEKPISEELLVSRMRGCAVRLCLEWLQRKGAISYKHLASGMVRVDGTNPMVLTGDFMRDLERHHKPLHEFAGMVLRQYGFPSN